MWLWTWVCTCVGICLRTNKQTNRQPTNQTNKQTNKQTNEQAHIHACIHTYLCSHAYDCVCVYICLGMYTYACTYIICPIFCSNNCGLDGKDSRFVALESVCLHTEMKRVLHLDTSEPHVRSKLSSSSSKVSSKICSSFKKQLYLRTSSNVHPYHKLPSKYLRSLRRNKKYKPAPPKRTVRLRV